MYKDIRFILKICLVVFYFFSFGNILSAQEVFFDYKDEILMEDEFVLDLKVDTKYETINSIEISFSFDSQKLEYLGFDEKNSIINLWVERPLEKDGKISFAGIIPGGVSWGFENTDSPKLNIISFYFKAIEKGESSFQFINTKILKHDGLGSELSHKNINSTFSIKEKKSLGLMEPKKESILVLDTNPPLPFEINFFKSGPISPQMILFDTKDNETGVKEYKIKSWFNKWHKIESPYVISKKLLSKKIYIRAYDFAENYQEANTLIPGFISTKFLFIFIFLLLAFFYFYKLLK